MDIIKSILHVFKKSDNAFKVMHPETESACITDWNTGIVNTLASTALGTLVSTLTSDSLLATMIQKVLTATGVKYNIAQNGYLCFGSLFGGLIIQWGRNYSDTMIGFPIAFSVPPIIIGCHWGTHNDINVVTKSDLGESEKYNADFLHSNYDGQVLVNWIAIGL